VKNLDELIYSLLLKSGYSRASVVFNYDLLRAPGQIGSQMQAPTFVIVDPDTADSLAVIEVVDAVDFDELKEVAVRTGAYASRLAGETIQGFVIKVNVHGKTHAEKIQFFRIWPNSTLYQLSSRNFPDLESLRVAKKLIVNSASKAIGSLPPISGSLGEIGSESETENKAGKGAWRQNAGLYFPAWAILSLLIIDAAYSFFIGEALLSIPQSLLALGAAALLTLPAAIRRLRQ